MELRKAVTVLLETQVNPALPATDHTAHLAALQLAGAAPAGHELREVVHTVVADEINNFTYDRVAIVGHASSSGLPEHQSPNSHGAVKNLAVHEGCGNVKLEFIERQLLLLLVQDEGVDQGHVSKVVENPLITLPSLGFYPARNKITEDE